MKNKYRTKLLFLWNEFQKRIVFSINFQYLNTDYQVFIYKLKERTYLLKSSFTKAK